MFQNTVYLNRESGLIEAKSLNNADYTHDDIKLFSETVCVEVGLVSLKTLITKERYEPSSLKTIIQTHAEAQGTEIYPLGYTMTNVTKTSITYHKMLFDTLYVKTLRDLPLMINHSDSSIIPVVNWRLQIGK